MNDFLNSKFEYFLKCAHEGSFLKASQKIGLSQPALSHAMKLLEEELNAKLFERSVHGIRLTEAGKALHSELSDIHKNIQSRINRSLGKKQKSLLRLGCVGHLASKYLLDVLETLKGELPVIHLFTSNSLECYEEVLKGSVDFAFVAWSSKPKRLKFIRVAQEAVAYVGLKSKFAEIENIKDIEELKKYPQVDLPKPQKDWTQILEPDCPGYLARDVRILRDIVLRGLAVGALQLSFFSKEEKSLLVRAQVPPPYSDAAIYAVYRKDIPKDSLNYLESITSEFKAATEREPTGE